MSAIGEADSEIRIHADWLLDGIVRPVFSERFKEFDVVRADTISTPGLIDRQVISHLLDADLVIADLSYLNPNAFYEIGIRHMAQKPIIHMHRSEERIPFDVSLYRSLKYARSRPADLDRAKAELADAVSAVLRNDYQVENPVTHVRGEIRLEQSATPEQRVLMERIAILESRVAAIDAPRRNSVRTQFEFRISFDSEKVSAQELQERVPEVMSTHINLIGWRVTILRSGRLAFRFTAPNGFDERAVEVARDVIRAMPGVGTVARVTGTEDD